MTSTVLKDNYKVKSAGDAKEFYIREYIKYLQEMLKQLRSWLQYKDSQYVFCTNKGNLLKISNYETNFKKYGKRIGLSGMYLYMLRNNFAKRFLMQGGDIYILSIILGHSYVKAT